MTEANYFNDTPITSPEDDRFGIDAFARAIATSIVKINSPIGATIALNGPWGSGKSSAVNLIRHHLTSAVESGELVIIDFKCWWFHGEEALTLAFLQELNPALEKNLGERVKELIPKLGKSLLRAGPVVGPAMNIVTGGFWGTIFGSSMDFASQFFSQDETVESVFNDLSKVLAEQNMRFLVVIDDIDRLSTEEALLTFRLAKSVGRLPNVIYLLVFDRKLAEKAVRQKYPSEGPHFLEKIIQASFEVPLPPKDDLNSATLAEIEKRCGEPRDQDQLKHLMNVFYDAVAPYINSPRDVARLSNAMAVSWPPIAGEVDIGDYAALETWRLFEPNVYNAIRTGKDHVCGLRREHRGQENQERELDRFAQLASERTRENVKDGLMRLFPRLENIGRGEEFLDIWDASRRVCSERHFDTYFRMALGSEVLSIKEIENFIERCSDSSFVRDAFLEAAATVRRNGKSKVPLLLDELNAHASQIAKEKFEPLLRAIFAVADEIYRIQDGERGIISSGDTYLRIHWLIRKLTFGRCELGERSKIFSAACENSQLGWLVDFAKSARDDYHPRSEGETPEPPERCLVTAEDLATLTALAITALRTTAGNGQLIAHPRLPYLLYRWRDFANDDGASVKAWTAEQLSNDVNVAYLAKGFISESWSQSFEDRVAVRHIKAGVDRLDTIMDVKAFRRRLEDIQKRGNLESPHRENVDILLKAWREKDRGTDN